MILQVAEEYTFTFASRQTYTYHNGRAYCIHSDGFLKQLHHVSLHHFVREAYFDVLLGPTASQHLQYWLNHQVAHLHVAIWQLRHVIPSEFLKVCFSLTSKSYERNFLSYNFSFGPETMMDQSKSLRTVTKVYIDWSYSSDIVSTLFLSCLHWSIYCLICCFSSPAFNVHLTGFTIV